MNTDVYSQELQPATKTLSYISPFFIVCYDKRVAPETKEWKI